MQLLEREALLDRLAGEHAAGRRHGRALFLGGEAGAGKTALVRAFAASTGGRAVVGHCDPLETPRPLAAIADLAWALGGPLAEAVERGAAVHHVARALVDALGATGLVVVEDLQWADAATLDVVRLACRRIEQGAGLLLATYRDDQIGRGDPMRVLLGDVGGLPGVGRAHVDLLSPAAVARLSAGRGLDPLELHRRTNGNPFFVTEILAAGGDAIPATVSDAVLARAARLTPPARALLDALAVVPEPCDWSLIEALVDDPAPRLEECCAAGLLAESEEFAGAIIFRHELARRALERALGTAARRGAHGRVLAHLAGAGADPARLAHHAEGAGDAAAMFEYAAAAGLAASAIGARTEALKHLRHALDHPPDIPLARKAGLFAALATEAYLADRSADAVAAQRSAVAIYQQMGDRRAEGQGLAMLSRMQWLDADLEGAFASVERALELLEPLAAGFELAMACSQRSAMAMLTDDHGGAIHWGTRALDLATACGAVDVQSHALNNMGTSEWSRGSESGREMLERSLELAVAADSLEEVGRAYANLADVAMQRLRPAAARRFIDAGLAYSRSRGLTRTRICQEHSMAALDTLEARYDSAGASLGFLLAAPALSAVTRIDVCTLTGLIRARRGDPGVWEALDEACERAAKFGESDRIHAARLAEMEAAFLAGDLNRALGVAEASAGQAAAEGSSAADEIVWWAARLGSDMAMPAWARQPFAAAAAGDHLGAAAVFAAIGWRYHEAMALHDAGDTASLRLALAICHEVDARPLARILARRLQTLGEASIARGPRGATRANAAGLTARQAEVLELLAAGRTNREIAAELVVSVRTVDHHVGAILVKLGAPGRDEAVTRARELGVVALPRSG